MDKTKECENCKWWMKQIYLGAKDNRVGSCRRYPPQFSAPVIGLPEPVGHHILTWDCDLCGEFEVK